MIKQVHDHKRASMPTRYISVVESEPTVRLLAVNVQTFEGKEGKNSFLVQANANGSSLCTVRNRTTKDGCDRFQARRYS